MICERRPGRPQVSESHNFERLREHIAPHSVKTGAIAAQTRGSIRRVPLENLRP